MTRAPELPAVRRYPRDVFLDQVWDYEPGEHVTILGKTGSGKTYLAQQLLQRTASPELPAVCLVLKARDKTVDQWRKKVEYKKVTFWSQPVTKWHPKQPDGYVVWPRHSFKTGIDDLNHYRVFEHAIMDNYRRGGRIIFADEATGLQRIGLTPEMETVWERGRAHEAGLWVTSQRPTFISSHAYTQASHVFLGMIKDKRARDRFGEISGLDRNLVSQVVGSLADKEWLYIRQEDSTMCIIEK